MMNLRTRLTVITACLAASACTPDSAAPARPVVDDAGWPCAEASQDERPTGGRCLSDER